jgi:hypothetical protein
MMPTQGDPGLKKNKRRRCLCCHQLFHCHPRTRCQQKYCSEPRCRAASKKASQQRWLRKPENQDYFSGPQHVRRVQSWREAHPDYGRGSRKRARPLQETITRQSVDRAQESAALALQDQIRLQSSDTVDRNGVCQCSLIRELEPLIVNWFLNSRIHRADRIGPCSTPVSTLGVHSKQSRCDLMSDVDPKTRHGLRDHIRYLQDAKLRSSGQWAICEPLSQLGDLCTAQHLAPAAALEHCLQSVRGPLM